MYICIYEIYLFNLDCGITSNILFIFFTHFYVCNFFYVNSLISKKAIVLKRLSLIVT